MMLPAYPGYKPSDVEWLGQVPDHWETIRLKYIASANDDVLSENTAPDWELLYVDIGSIDPFVGITSKEPMFFEDAPSRARRLVADGDTIVSTVRTYLKAISFMREPESNLVVSTGFAVIRPQTVDPHFLGFCLRSGYFVESVVSRSTGVSYPATNASEILNISIPLPEISEQKAIASFLNFEISRIDLLTAKKKELLERLTEQRAAIISQSVTRGLPPLAARALGCPENPPLKPTGLDWLGDIPAHWEIKQLKWAIMFQRGHDLPADEREDGQVPLVTSAGVSTFISKAAARGPGIVTGRYGTIGNFYLIEDDYWPLNTTLYSIELRGNNPSFLRYMLVHLAPLFLVNANKSAVPGVDRNDIHPTTTAIPPLSEQIAIAAYLDAETSKLDALQGKIGEAIERLQEYRTALITAAVTGKIDVREVSA